jgi:hypothetical protein
MELVKVTVQEINAPPSATPIVPAKQEEPVVKKDKKKKKKKNKGIDAFLEDQEEAKLFAEQPLEEVKTKEKKKKSVGFNLEQNQVLEFDKTKKITEIAPSSQENEVPSKKSIAKENMDDLVNRTNKQSKKPTNTEEIIKLSRSESVNNAVLKTVQTPENGS